MSIPLNLLASGVIPLIFSLNAVFPLRFHYQTDSTLLKNEKREFIENKIQEFASKLMLNKQVELLVIKDMWGGAQAQGIALLPGRIGIALEPEIVNYMYETDLEFIIAHELSHIKKNDLLTMFAIPGLMGVTTTLAINILFPSSAAHHFKLAAGSFAVSLISFVFFSRWREECADHLGFSMCSKAAQAEAGMFFEEIRKSQIDYRNNPNCSFISKIWRKFLITEDGDYRLGVTHPPMKKRINYLKIKES